MLIPSRAWGFIRSGLNGRFGVTVPNFGTGGPDGNPLDNDVDAGDEAAGVEFCPVFASQPSSGTLTVFTDGSAWLEGAANGTYVLPYSLYTFTPGDSASVDEGATTYTVTVGSATELDLDPATLALSGALSISGDIQIGTSFDMAADPVALSGSIAVSGDIEASVDPVLDIDATAVALSGSLAVSGDIDIGTSFDVEASALAMAGAVSISGDIEIGTTFDLATDPVALAGSLALAGDVEASETPVQSGILEIEWEPNLWWKRKPRALPEKVAREKLKKAATVIAKKAEEQVRADVVAEKEQRKAEAREAVRPMLAEMPGFDWQALYDEAYSRALNAAVAQAMREQEAMAQAKAAIDRARLLDDEDVEILMALL